MNFEDIPCLKCLEYNKCEELDAAGDYSLRRCQRAVEQRYYTEIHDMDVLEIGCGTRAKGGFIKDIVEKNNCRWTGIDVIDTDLATHVCSVEKMPFEAGTFDWVVGAQTLEHWKRPRRSLKEISRVLRPGGKVSLTAPVHLHGEKMFVTGRFDRIKSLFLKSPLNLTKIETWRRQYCGLSPYRPNEYAQKKLRKVGITDYDGISQYIIHCTAVKEPNTERKGVLAKLLTVR